MARRKSVASLGVTLIARTSSFKKRMKAARAITKRFASAAFGAGKAIAKMGVAVVAAGLAISTVLIKRQLTAIDKLAKTAEKLGVLNNELLVLRRAAGFAGAEMKSLDDGLLRFGRSISEAAAGDKILQESFAELGLDVILLQTMSLADAFKLTSRAFQDQASTTNQLRLSYDLFGRKGNDLLVLMNAADEAFIQAEKDMHQFGLTVTQVAGQQVQTANDSFSALGDLMVGVFRQAAIEIAPIAEAISESILGIGRSGDDMQTTVQSAFGVLVATIGGALQAVVGFADDIALSSLLMKDAVLGTIDAFKILDSIRQRHPFDAASDAIDRLRTNAATRKAERVKFSAEALERQLKFEAIPNLIKDIQLASQQAAQKALDVKQKRKDDAAIKANNLMQTAFDMASLAIRGITGGKQLGSSKSNPVSTEAPDVVKAVTDLSDVLRSNLRLGGVAL